MFSVWQRDLWLTEQKLWGVLISALAEITEVHPTYLSLPFYVACLFTIGHQQVAVLDSVTISCWRLYRETSSATIRKTHDLHRFT